LGYFFSSLAVHGCHHACSAVFAFGLVAFAPGMGGDDASILTDRDRQCSIIYELSLIETIPASKLS